MPRLVLFAPCQKAVISQGDNTLSVIAVLDQIVTVLPVGSPTELPPATYIPMHWDVIAVWFQADDDADRKYEQRIRLVSDNETLLESPVAAFTIETGKQEQRVASHFMGFPIWKTGVCELKLLLREVGNDDWKEISSYPVTIRYKFSDNLQEVFGPHPA